MAGRCIEASRKFNWLALAVLGSTARSQETLDGDPSAHPILAAAL